MIQWNQDISTARSAKMISMSAGKISPFLISGIVDFAAVSRTKV